MYKCKLIDVVLAATETFMKHKTDPASALCTASIKDMEDFLCEKLVEHLQDYFSYDYDEYSWEHTQDLDCWTLEDMVAYYKENAR